MTNKIEIELKDGFFHTCDSYFFRNYFREYSFYLIIHILYVNFTETHWVALLYEKLGQSEQAVDIYLRILEIMVRTQDRLWTIIITSTASN